MRKIAILGLALPLLALAGSALADQGTLSREAQACIVAGVDPHSPALEDCAQTLRYDMWYDLFGPGGR